VEQSRYNCACPYNKALRQYKFPRGSPRPLRRSVTGGRAPFQKFVFGPPWSFSFTWKMPDVSHVAGVTCNAVVPTLSWQCFIHTFARIQIAPRSLGAARHDGTHEVDVERGRPEWPIFFRNHAGVRANGACTRVFRRQKE